MHDLSKSKYLVSHDHGGQSLELFQRSHLLNSRQAVVWSVMVLWNFWWKKRPKIWFGSEDESNGKLLISLYPEMVNNLPLLVVTVHMIIKTVAARRTFSGKITHLNLCVHWIWERGKRKLNRTPKFHSNFKRFYSFDWYSTSNKDTKQMPTKITKVHTLCTPVILGYVDQCKFRQPVQSLARVKLSYHLPQKRYLSSLKS